MTLLLSRFTRFVLILLILGITAPLTLAAGEIPNIEPTPAVAAVGDGSVTLRWNKAESTKVIGYTVYYGESPLMFRTRMFLTNEVLATPAYYSYSKPVENVLETKIDGLQNGRIYYFALTARVAEGGESMDYSPEAAAIPDPSGIIANVVTKNPATGFYTAEGNSSSFPYDIIENEYENRSSAPAAMFYVSFLIPLALFILVPVLAYRSSMKQQEKLKQIAMELGLQCKDNVPAAMQIFGQQNLAGGSTPFPTTPSSAISSDSASTSRYTFEQASHATTIPGMMPAQTSNFLARILSAFHSFALVGKYNGIPVDIHMEKRGSKNKTTYSCITAFIEPPLSLGLEISHEGFLAKIGKTFGQQDIQIGQSGLDSKLLIKGKNDYQVQELLYKIPVQMALEQAFKYNNAFKLSDQRFYLEITGFLLDTHRYREILAQMTAVVKAIQENRRDKPSV